MATISILLFITLLLTTLPQTQPLLFSNYHTLLSLSHSLTTRVANIRDARGDYAGAARARQLSQTIEKGLGFNFYKIIFTLGYDFFKNYAFSSLFGFGSPGNGDLNELISSVNDFTRLDSAEQRAVWVKRNHGKLIRVLRGLIDSLVGTFSRKGPLKDMFETLQKEVVDGGLLKDCLQVGGDDLVGVVKILKDIATQYYPSKKTDL